MWSPSKRTMRRVRRDKGGKNGNNAYRPALSIGGPRNRAALMTCSHLGSWLLPRRNYLNKARVHFAQPNIPSPPLTTHTARSRNIISMDCSERESRARDPWSRGEHCIIPHHLLHALTPQISYTYFLVHIHLREFTPQCVHLRIHTSGCILPVCISEYTPCSQHHLHFYQEGTTDTHWYSKLTWQCVWALSTNSWETLPAISQCWPPVLQPPTVAHSEMDLWLSCSICVSSWILS